MVILYNVENLRALRFKNLQAFFNRPPDSRASSTHSYTTGLWKNTTDLCEKNVAWHIIADLATVSPIGYLMK